MRKVAKSFENFRKSPLPARGLFRSVSRPVYSPAELAEINRRSTEPVEWKGREMTRYEASQKQRQLETKIR